MIPAPRARPGRGRRQGGRARVRRGRPGVADLGDRACTRPGDCTGVLMLASVAAMQGRIAMWHTLGEAVHPLRLSHVAATIFTDPEIATVGVSQRAVTAGEVSARVLKLPLATNPRAKMQGVRDGFVKLFAQPGHRRRARRRGGRAARQRAHPGRVHRRRAAPHRRAAGADVRRVPVLSGSLTEAARKLMEFTAPTPRLSGRAGPGRGRRGVRGRAGAAGRPGCRPRTRPRCPRCRSGTARAP
jgi:hypothetical protein